MTEPADKEWLTVAQVAERLQLHEETIRRWIRDGQIPVLDLGKKAGYRSPAGGPRYIHRGTAWTGWEKTPPRTSLGGAGKRLSPVGGGRHRASKGITMARTKRRGHGEGSIFQAKSDGRWVAALILPDGKRKYLYGKTRKEAADKLKRARGTSRTASTSARTADRRSLPRQVALGERQAFREATRRTSPMRAFAAPRSCHGSAAKKLAKLTALDLQVPVRGLRGCRDSVAAHPSIMCIASCIGAFAQAVRWKLLPRNPCDGATSPKAPRAELNVWSPEEADTFLLATREHRLHALYVLALTTGMRQGELLGLRWSDIDSMPEPSPCGAPCNGSEASGSCSPNQRQRAPAARFISVQTALAALRAHQDRQAFERHAVGAAWNDNDLVFCDAVGDPLSPTNETKRFQRAAAVAGTPAHPLPRPAPHCGDDPARQRRARQARLGDARAFHDRADARHLLPRHPRHARRCRRGDGCGVQRVTRS